MYCDPVFALQQLKSQCPEQRPEERAVYAKTMNRKLPLSLCQGLHNLSLKGYTK